MDSEKYEATLTLGTGWEPTYVTIESRDQRIVTALVEAVKKAFDAAHSDGLDATSVPDRNTSD